MPMYPPLPQKIYKTLAEQRKFIKLLCKTAAKKGKNRHVKNRALTKDNFMQNY